MAKIYVRRLGSPEREIVHTIILTNTSPSHVERVVRGLLRNMNTDEYYVDDSEANKEPQP